MPKTTRLTSAMVLVGVLLMNSHLAAQIAPKGEVALTKLAPPTYPPLARQARLIGEVEIYLEIGRNGGIATAKVTKGHPLLAESALNSAKQSQFECRNCNDVGSSYLMVYTFELDLSKCELGYGVASSLVSRNENHVSLLAVTPCVDHMPLKPYQGEDGRRRTAKCLYLWKCGPPRFFTQ